MRKRMTTGDLKKYCATIKPARIHFSTENQLWFKVSDPCKVDLSFPVMLIYENPNLILLKSDTSLVSLDRVKFIEVDTETTVLGTIFTVVCGSQSTSENDITYRLIVA
ncbi:MAG: hypothetical protein NC548_48730 [Lachnospiraceae bacterium]|nr:hypothetical protein [Lachnospiraceae bacterium]MCM1236353.1 hypothetical protein [Ruminococcus flavefaciens]